MKKLNGYQASDGKVFEGRGSANACAAYEVALVQDAAIEAVASTMESDIAFYHDDVRTNAILSTDEMKKWIIKNRDELLVALTITAVKMRKKRTTKPKVQKDVNVMPADSSSGASLSIFAASQVGH